MNSDIPEPEILHAEETVSVARVQMRLLGRAIGTAAVSLSEFVKYMREAVGDLLPMDDPIWDATDE